MTETEESEFLFDPEKITHLFVLGKWIDIVKGSYKEHSLPTESGAKLAYVSYVPKLHPNRTNVIMDRLVDGYGLDYPSGR